MSRSEVRFCVAGLEVLLGSSQHDGLSGLSGFYRDYPPASASPEVDLEIEIERVPGFTRGRERGPDYPGFERALEAPGVVVLSRFDAEGRIILPPAGTRGPVRARFRVGESRNSLEAAVRIGVSMALPRRGGLVLHASAVASRGGALVFAGVSGAGKSTISAMLAALPGTTKVSDELLAVTEPGGATTRWTAHVTPFMGSDGLPHGASLPITAIHFLAQAPHHRRSLMARTDALRELMRHVLVYVAEPDTASRVLALAARVAGEIPCYRLEFAKDPGVAEVVGVT